MTIIHFKRAVACFVSVLFFTSSGYARQFKNYTDSVRHFVVSVPEEWAIIPNYKESYFLAYRPLKYKGESKIENVVLSKINDSAAHNLNEAFSYLVRSNRLRDSTLVIAKDSLSEKPAYHWYISTNKIGNTGETVESLTAVFFIKKSTYVLQCTASPETFNAYKTIFLKIAGSFRFK